MYKNLILKQNKIKELGHRILNLNKNHSLEDANKKLNQLEETYKELFDLINKEDITNINKNKSNIFIFHNHHLAYYCWKKSVLDKKIGKNNILLHFDAHRDIKVPNFKEINDLNEYSERIEKVKNKIDCVKGYVLDKLWIDNYIFPAIKEGIIDEILWVAPDFIKLGIGPKLLKKVYFDKDKNGFAEKAGVLIETLYLSELIKRKIKNKKIILNIDIDYFSCKEHGKIATEQEIERSINDVFSVLDKLKPDLITIALSPDYVLYEQIDFIEKMLVEKFRRT